MKTLLGSICAGSLALVLTGPVAAQGLFVDSPEGCDIVLGSPDGDLDYAGEGGLLLGADGYSSLEYFCSFSPNIDFQWNSYQVRTHVGQCEMPGPEYQPRLFTVVTDPDQPDLVSIFTGDADPLRFYRCRS